jgi:hypothetical protein
MNPASLKGRSLLTWKDYTARKSAISSIFPKA